MAKVYLLPNQSTRALIHTFIQLKAANKWSQQRMMTEISNVLESYGCTSLNMGNYAVRIEKSQVYRGVVYPTVIITGTQILANRSCPACESQEFYYLCGGDDNGSVTGICVDCGYIYGFIHRKEESV